jgi:hypothetical protein
MQRFGRCKLICIKLPVELFTGPINRIFYLFHGTILEAVKDFTSNG